jgi:hypothetical protein
LATGVRPSTAIGGNGGVNLLFDTVDVLFGTVDREGVGNEARANLLLLLPLWTALHGSTPRSFDLGGSDSTVFLLHLIDRTRKKGIA